MAKKRSPTKTTEDNGSNDAPLGSLPLNFEFNEQQWAELHKSQFSVFRYPLAKPLTDSGKVYRWLVAAVKFTPEGKLVPIGQALACQNEAEAETAQQDLFAKCRCEEEARQREEAERPVPGETRAIVPVVTCQRATMKGTPLSAMLTQPKSLSVSSEPMPPDEPILNIANASYHGSDGNGQAMKVAVTKKWQTEIAFRLVRYIPPIQQDGRAYSWGVEFAELAECSLKGNVLRVMERSLYASETEAKAVMERKKIEAPKRRARLLNEPVKSEEETKEDALIQQIKRLAEGGHDSTTKARHLARIEEILEQRRERNRATMEAAEKSAREKVAAEEALNILMDDNFPNVAKVQAKLKAANAKSSPQYLEDLRRATKIDCARLGIPSPANVFAMDARFTVEVAKAHKSKSPFKPDQMTAVLNWFGGKDYQSMTEKQWTADVTKQIKAPVNAGLGKTISKKFGLKSKLKGRPETESGKKSEG